MHSQGYTLHGLQPASVYETSVSSKNRFGWSDASSVIRFATGGEGEAASDPNAITKSTFFRFSVELPDYSTENLSESADVDEERNLIPDNSSSAYDEVTLHHVADGASATAPRGTHSEKHTLIIILLLLLMTYLNVFSN